MCKVAIPDGAHYVDAVFQRETFLKVAEKKSIKEIRAAEGKTHVIYFFTQVAKSW